MTKKHFGAMADYIASLKNRGQPDEYVKGAYDMATYIAKHSNFRFDQGRFDAWIDKRASK